MIQTDSRILDYVGAGMLIFVFLVLVYGIIYIHDIPYGIAKKRNHPHQDAIHAAGWVSLFMLHAIWPFLWIWAMIHKPDMESDEAFVEHEVESPSTKEVAESEVKPEASEV
ncbi:DUF3302 domain-containing protein [Desulfovibrio sp. JC022]|uniref:DUF3302 domain-containing protein n=1 Tax=Desulfovibrio sp. JC022 TaxID=2593642 RepID=UPI0013D34FA2|nr:DUF3302 domain-containing protein [Desulfovibrio sp. JC022]NDV21343.1 DUF3302 domain-containing protein [Desulfovibrio sp. JC022]